ncbi:MAG: apolipoprotein N-acyltransferase [SAR116 cluster bacterium]|nr:apolipoprotein N-acyltransferase [SAR116 cluster bacterium]
MKFKINKFKNNSNLIKYPFLFLIGILATFSLPPFSIFPCVFLISISIFYLLNSDDLKEAFLIGFFLAFGWFLVSLYWISNAILTGGKEFFWMIPFVFFGLPALLSIFWGLAFFFTNLIGQNITERLFLLSILFPLFEWLRGNILSGFPWNMLGFSLSSPLEFAQTISFLGPYGQNILIVFLITIPVSFYYNKKFFLSIATVVSVAALLTSTYLYNNNKIRFTKQNIRIVQPNFSHFEKWDKSKYFINQEKLIELSNDRSNENFLIIWPETAIVNFIDKINEDISYIVDNIFYKNSGILIAGIPRKEMINSKNYYYNSMIAIDQNGEILGNYDKKRLVPFGEYNPFRAFLSFFSVIATDKEFSKGGRSNQFFAFNNLNLFPMICYEAIFPFKANKDKSYDLIINITNDAWFGETLGPEQHFWLAKQRAVETGIPMVRVSNSGISSLIAPNGEEIESLNFGSSGFLELKIPEKFKQTLYLKFGEKIYYLITLVLIFTFIFFKRRGFN